MSTFLNLTFQTLQYIFEWKLNDTVIIKKKNNKPQRFENVQVGAGVGGENGGHDSPANAMIRNLDYTSKGNRYLLYSGLMSVHKHIFH